MKLLLITICFYLCVAQRNQKSLNEFSTGNNLFTASIYKEIIKSGNKNILVSPLSVQIVLALTQSGAKDETKEEVRSTLHLPETEEKIKSSFKKLLNDLKSQSNQYKLHTANKIYVKENLSVKQDFKQLTHDIYHADLENVDFTRQNDAANTINQWVEKQTENKIKNLVDPADLDETTALILVNALYFRGRWEKPFNQLSTKKNKFYKTKNDVIEVDTMYLKRKMLGYYESQELKAKFAEMYFEGGQVSMVIVLPDEKEGLAELESKIKHVFTPRRFGVQKLNLALPKFQINSKTDFKEILEKVRKLVEKKTVYFKSTNQDKKVPFLQTESKVYKYQAEGKLGVHTAFSEQADFSKISGKKGDLHVSKIIQKAFIDVNEEGVEATAATELEFVLGSTRQMPKNFIVDHPFIYYIKANDVILFAGKVSDPSK